MSSRFCRREHGTSSGRRKEVEVLRDAPQILPSLSSAAQRAGWPPLSIVWGKGAHVGDLENNVYTDFHLAGGDLILGHAPRNVVLAVKKYAERGIRLGLVPKVKIDVARFLARAVPSCEQLEFVYDRQAALKLAIRLAQKATGKIRVARVVENFPGAQNGPVGMPSSSATVNEPALAYPGQSLFPWEVDLYLPFNNLERCEQLLSAEKETTACVLLEPVQSLGGIRPATKEFLRALRDWATKRNFVLIFDESQTGFRGRLAGYQGEFGILPDVTCLGGILGGGFSLSAVGGKKNILRHLPGIQDYAPADNPIIFRAALATLKLLTPDFYRSLNAQAEKLACSLNQSAQESGVGIQCQHYHSLLGMDLSGILPADRQGEGPARAAAELETAFQENLLKQRIIWPPSIAMPFFISSAHRGKDFVQLEAGLKIVFNLVKIAEKSYDAKR